MTKLPKSAILFIALEAAGALVICAFGFSQWKWSPSGLGTFLALLALCSATGAMRVSVPGVQSNMSVSIIFLLWGVVNIGLAGALLMGWAASLVQTYWRAKKKPALVHLIFNLAVTAVAIGFGSLSYSSKFGQVVAPNPTLRIFLAAVAYFLVNTLSVSTVIGLTEGFPWWRPWRESILWSFPNYALGASIVAAVEYFKKWIGIEVAIMILPGAYVIYQVFVMHVARLNQTVERAEQEKKHAEETAELHLRTIRALALAIEAKDQTTGLHLHRVQTYAMELGKDFGLSPREMEALQAAAILHDVGKLAVPENIISKPGKLTHDEFAKMKIHTIVGAEIVESINFPFVVAPLVRSHHEKWDGSGYPDGLKGEEIPIGARILSTVDCLDALASDRQYRKAMPLEKAMSIVVAESGKAFDPRVVEALQKRYLDLENLASATQQKDTVKLSVNAIVARGLAPDAGYAVGTQPLPPLTGEELAQEALKIDSITSRIGQLDSAEADLLAIEPILRELIPFDCLALYRRRCDQLECVLAIGESAPLFRGLTIETGVGVSGWTSANRTPLMNGNAATEFGVVGQVNPEFSLVSGLSIPLESETGVIGTFTLYSCRRDAFQLSHLRALLAISSRLTYQANLDFSGNTARASPTSTSQIERLSQAVGFGSYEPAHRPQAGA